MSVIGISFTNTGQMIDEQTGLPVRIRKQYKTVNLAELMELDFPDPEYVIEPWLPMRGICMIFAKAGVGKTWAALDCALSAAAGKPAFDHWKVPERRRVLYIDGEMDGAELRERIQRLMISKGISVEVPMRVMGLSMQDESMPMIDNPLEQESINDQCEWAQLIFVDNLSSLTSMPENEGESWLPVQQWALRMRAQGKAVVFIHHAGKGGDQRGTSRRSDVMNTVVQLKPIGDDTEENTAFDLTFSKTRGFSGPDTIGRRIELRDAGNGLVAWHVVKLTDLEQDDLVDYIRDGWNYNDIAQELGITKGAVSKRAKRAIEEGKLSAEELPKRGRSRQ